MLARRRAGGDEAKRRIMAQDLGKLSTELLVWLLDDDQLRMLREMERGQ